MESMTLLRVPDLADAVEPFLSSPVDTTEIFRLVAAGLIRPLGYVVRAPVFSPQQVAEVVAVIQAEQVCSPNFCRNRDAPAIDPPTDSRESPDDD